jgi:4-carboxymuconolactone decarboxylase
MARIPYKQAADAEGENKVLLESLDANVARMLGNAEGLAPPLHGFLATFFSKLELPVQLRELVILLVGKTTEADYEWNQHVPIAERLGISSEKIDAIDRGDLEANCLTEVEQAVLVFTAQMLAGPRPDDAALERLAAAGLDPGQMVEVTLVAGGYQLLAHVITVFDVDEDPPFPAEKFESMVAATSED